MAAIATTILTFVRPGDVILHSQPLYGGTEALFAKTLGASPSERWALPTASTKPQSGWRRRRRPPQRPGCKDFYRNPANPTNGLVHIAMVRRVAEMISQTQGHTPMSPATIRCSGRCFSGDRTRRGSFVVLANQI